MNLFRSEEHATQFSGFSGDWSHTLLPVERWAEIFSNPIFKERGRPDYISWLRSDVGQAAMLELRASMPVRNS